MKRKRGEVTRAGSRCKVEEGGGVKMRAKGKCEERETAVCQLPAGPHDLGIAWPNLGKR